MPRKDFTDITIILDRSGSMASVVGDTIGGFNAFVEDQRKAPGTAMLTLRQFDDQHEVVYSKPIQDAPGLTLANFLPRGSTALLDAVGMAITETGKRFALLPDGDRPEHVIFAIITDGEENASRIYNRAKVFELISHQRDIYKWQFTFIGANQDAIQEASKIGIPMFAALNYTSTPTGTANAFHAASAGMTRMRSGSAVAMSYTQSERDDAMKFGDEDQTGHFLPDEPSQLEDK